MAAFDILDYMAEHKHEELLFYVDPVTELHAIIALHNTIRGPALGGVRLMQYETNDGAVRDALCLAEAMTYKAVMAELPLGGGKAVILADGREKDPATRALRFQSFGRFVNSLAGRYITTEDVGTTSLDMSQVQLMTSSVVGTPVENGGSGDPSSMTAFGVMQGIQALLEEVIGTSSLTGHSVAIQGLGKVGMSLAKQLVEAGARVIGSDIRPQVLQEAKTKLHMEVVEPDAIYDVHCTIFAPCAYGGVINDRTISRLSCQIIAGCANNQLEDERHGEMLHERGIIYAVDYVVNAGGLIKVAQQLNGYDEAKARQKTAHIYHTTKQMLTLARQEGISTQRATQQMVLARLQSDKRTPCTETL